MQMKIGFADNKNIKDLYGLWKLVFGDSDSTVDLFMKRSFSPENTAVCYDGKKLVSMLFLLPEKIKLGNGIFDAYYIYAAATEPQYRKRGIMEKLIDFSAEVCENRKIPFIFLVPANEHLFDYYKKFKFKACIKQKTLTLTKESILEFTCANNKSKFSFEIDKISDIKAKSFKNIDYVLWRKNETELFYEYLKQSGGKAFTVDSGYTAFEQFGDAKEIYEFCAEADGIGELMNTLFDGETTEKYNFNLAVNFPLVSDSQKTKTIGMVKSVFPENENLIKADIYTGITLA